MTNHRKGSCGSQQGRCAHQKSVIDIMRSLKTHKTDHNKELMTWISQKSWHHINEVPESVRASWPGIFPRLIPADECWLSPSNGGDKRLPTYTDVWKASFRIIMKNAPNRPGSYHVQDISERPSTEIATVMAHLRPELRM